MFHDTNTDPSKNAKWKAISKEPTAERLGCSCLSLGCQGLILHLRDTNCSMNAVWWWFQHPRERGRVDSLDERVGDFAWRVFTWAFSCLQRLDFGYIRAFAPPLNTFFCTLQDCRIVSLSCSPSANHALLSLSPQTPSTTVVILASLCCWATCIACIIAFPLQPSPMSLFNLWLWELYLAFFLFSPICKRSTVSFILVFTLLPLAF